eukprot:1156620-Pelagomonas_calceolata.AAC.8
MVLIQLAKSPLILTEHFYDVPNQLSNCPLILTGHFLMAECLFVLTEYLLVLAQCPKALLSWAPVICCRRARAQNGSHEL